MASTLEKLDPQQANNILSGLVKNLTPQPDDPVPLDDTSFALLRELQERAKVMPDDRSEQAVGKLLNIITEELTIRLLDKDSEEETKTRLGMRGDLPLNSYKIELPVDFRETESRGISRTQVLETIRQPDNVQHLLPDRATNAPRVSIFVKRVPSRKDPSALLVQCTRDGSRLQFSIAWRIFLSDFPPMEQSEPVDLLRAFAHKYGFPFFVGDKGPFQFLLYEVIQQNPSQKTDLVRVEKNELQRHSIGITCLVRISPLGLVEIAIAYAIDLTNYARDLRSHGIQILVPKG